MIIRSTQDYLFVPQYVSLSFHIGRTKGKQLWNELMPVAKDAHLCKPERYSWLYL